MPDTNTIAAEIAIIGAGPSGASASLFLAKKKIPHLIFDKSFFPRDKVCGDALSGKVVEVLKKLDPSLLQKITADQEKFLGSWGVKFVAPNGKNLDIPFKSNMANELHAPGFISRRTDWDAFLVDSLDTNYARKMEGCEVKKMTRTKDGVKIHFLQNGKEQIANCKLIIGCDGDRSIVEKEFAPRQMEPEHYCAGIRAYYKNVNGMHAQNFIELHFLDELLPGYFWIFPMANGYANVGAGMLSSRISKNKVNLREQMLKAIKENPNIKHRFANAELDGKIMGWGLPLGSKKREIAGERFMLCGDAASLIDPFTGEGIGNAMYSGMLAAESAAMALRENNFSADFLEKNYSKVVYARLWDELKLSHTLQRLSAYPKLFNFVVNKAEKNKTLRDTISCMFEDLDLRSRLRNPLFYLKLLVNN